MAKYSLIGTDGNAFSILGNVSRWMRSEKFTQKEIDEYMEKAKSGDYNNLIAVSVHYTDLCNQRAGSSNMMDDSYEDEDIELKYMLPDEHSEQGNAYYIVGYVSNAMKTEGFNKNDIADYVNDAMSGDYEHLRNISQEWLDKCNQI